MKGKPTVWLSYLASWLDLPYNKQEVEEKINHYIALGSICVGCQEIFQFVDSYSMPWISQNVVEKFVAFLWQVKTDQQQRGEFFVLVSSFHSSFFVWSLEIMASTSSNGNNLKTMKNFIKLDGIFNLKSVMDCYIPTFFNLHNSICSKALTFLSETLQATVLSSFIAALVGEGAFWYPRPMELNSSHTIHSDALETCLLGYTNLYRGLWISRKFIQVEWWTDGQKYQKVWF